MGNPLEFGFKINIGIFFFKFCAHLNEFCYVGNTVAVTTRERRSTIEMQSKQIVITRNKGLAVKR